MVNLINPTEEGIAPEDVTLATVSFYSTDATKSTYQMTTAVDVTFLTADSTPLLLLSNNYFSLGPYAVMGSATLPARQAIHWSDAIGGGGNRTAYGNLHFSPIANSSVTSLTFGGAQTGGGEFGGAQAGIFVHSADNFGTRMFFGTTSSYGAGAQMRMEIDAVGKFTFGGNGVTVGTASDGSAFYFKSTDTSYSTTPFVQSIHSANGGPYIAGFFNDTFSTTTPVMAYYAADTGVFNMGTFGANFQLGAGGSLNAGSTARMTIDYVNGYIGVNTTAPSSVWGANKFIEIKAAGNGAGLALTNTNSVTSAWEMIAKGGSAGELGIIESGNTWLIINKTTGDTVIGSALTPTGMKLTVVDGASTSYLGESTQFSGYSVLGNGATPSNTNYSIRMGPDGSDLSMGSTSRVDIFAGTPSNTLALVYADHWSFPTYQVQIGHNTTTSLSGSLLDIRNTSATEIYFSGSGTTNITSAGSDMIVSLAGNLYLSGNTAAPTMGITVDNNNNIGMGVTPSTTYKLDVNGTVGIASGSALRMKSAASNTDLLLYAASPNANIAAGAFYPATGTNVASTFAVIPKGTGVGGFARAQFAMFNTDFVADSTNWATMIIRSSGATYNIFQAISGTGATLPTIITSSSVSSTPQIYLHEGGIFTGFGQSSPTARVHIGAGTTTVAPLEFTSASLKTSNDLAGDVQFLTDKAYLTISTGTAVKEITLNDSALTSGMIPIATTNGRLTDSGFSTTNLVGTNYTPTATNVTNITASTPNNATYSRVGNVVTVAGSITVTNTLAVASEVDVSLPIASNLGAATDLNGTASMDSTASVNIFIVGDIANDRARIFFTSAGIGQTSTIYYTYQYKVI